MKKDGKCVSQEHLLAARSKSLDCQTLVRLDDMSKHRVYTLDAISVERQKKTSSFKLSSSTLDSFQAEIAMIVAASMFV